MLYINALNIHNGGGKSLLDALVKSNLLHKETYFLLDSRYKCPINIDEIGLVKKVRPTVVQRVLAYRWLSENVRVGDVVLCFNNLPPIFKLNGRTIVYLQNRYLVDYISLADFSWRSTFRIHIERYWLKLLSQNVDEFIVQTPSMKYSLSSTLNDKYSATTGNKPFDISILPFVNSSVDYSREQRNKINKLKVEYDFVYVASGEPHKNHKRLLEAWSMLAKEGIYPSLVLTLDQQTYPELCELIEDVVLEFKLNIFNLGFLSHTDMDTLYRKCKSLVYPSIFESFGLPLIEARQMGLTIIAAELDYVRDVVDPEQTFDASSAISIARAVKRFMEVGANQLPLHNSSEFISTIVEGK